MEIYTDMVLFDKVQLLGFDLLKFFYNFFILSLSSYRLLNILDATEGDEILLKYWMTSLSQSYRAHLLETSVSSQDSKETIWWRLKGLLKAGYVCFK